MDPFSHRLANALAGNPRTAATLEVSLTGPELEFDDERVVAVAGAVFSLSVDGQEVPHERPFVVGAHGRLRFGARTAGARAYVAVAGGFDAPVVLGSRSTHVRCHIGGWQGRALMRGDRLPLGPPHPVRVTGHSGVRWVSDTHLTPIRSMPAGQLRVMPGPESDRFLPSAFEALQAGTYVVANDSDRMGYRLTGAAVLPSKADIISDATPCGTLQVPESGQPILLMADCQTTGGYARMGVVIRADLGIAGQAAPGDTLSFCVCSQKDALVASIARERQLMAIEALNQ